MQREIKFRLPICCNNCKFKGFQYHEWNGQTFTGGGYDKCACEKPGMELCGELQQFTGLLDKNGKDIYEGDIVKKENGNIEKVIFCQRWAQYGTENKNRFDDLGRAEHFTDEYGLNRNVEIIGNIYENPKLYTKE